MSLINKIFGVKQNELPAAEQSSKNNESDSPRGQAKIVEVDYTDPFGTPETQNENDTTNQ